MCGPMRSLGDSWCGNLIFRPACADYRGEATAQDEGARGIRTEKAGSVSTALGLGHRANFRSLPDFGSLSVCGPWEPGHRYRLPLPGIALFVTSRTLNRNRRLADSMVLKPRILSQHSRTRRRG